MITITDGQTDLIVDDIHEDFFWDDRHYQSMKDTLETFDFTTFADKPFSEHLTKNNRIIIPGEDGELLEFIIQNTRKYRSQQGRLLIDVFTSASYIELCKAKVIEPQRLQGATAKSAVQFAVQDTEWQVGEVDYAGIRSINIESHTNPYKLLKTIASTFDLELKFRVEHDGNKITKRYVDLLERVGRWQGREIEFGKDLIGIERKEDTSNVVTALVGLGPEREDGTRLQVFVEDRNALQRWGRNGRHIIDVYEPQSTDVNMTENRLRELTQNELKKRVNSVVEYICEEADLEHVLGFEHEKVRFGDTIRIKDKGFTPPLYLEARVHTQERSIKKRGMKRIILGDYVEYTEEDIQAIWKSLQSQIANKMSLSDVLEVTYTKEEIDEKDKPGKEAKEKIDQDVGTDVIESVTGSRDKAEQAKQEAISEAVNQAQQSLNDAVDALETSIAEKADATWVNNQLQLKADNETVSTIQDAVNDLQETASSLQQAVNTHADELEAHGGKITKLETDYDELNGTLSAAITELSNLENTVSRHETEIQANAQAISLKANQEELDELSGTISGISSELTVMAGKIEAKAEKSELEELENDVLQINTELSNLKVDVEGISTNVSNLSQTVTNHGAQISNINSSITQLSGEIESKVDKTEYETDKDGIISRLNSAETRITQTENEIQTKVNQTTFDALENRVTQAESTITQTADNVTLAFNRIDSIDGVLNSAVTTIDASGVTVKDGSFYLEDDTSDTKYSIVPKTNLLGDHSFEMLERTGTQDATHGDFAIKPQIDSNMKWRTVGSPRLLSALLTDLIKFKLFYHGLQAVVVSNSNYVEQHFPYIPGKTYTVSAYFTGSSRSTSGVPRIDVRLEDGITGEVKKTWTKSFQSVTNGQKLTRNSLTFTVPADADNDYGGDVVIVAIRANSGWVVADGAQVVEGETPSLYDPENSLWALLRGVKGYEFSSLDVNGEINGIYVNRIWGNENNEKYVSFYNSVDGTEDAFLGIVGNGDFVLRHKKGPLRLQSGTTRIFFNFNNSTGNTLTFEGGMIRNLTGNGDLSLSSGDGAGVLMLRSPTREIRMLIGNDGLRVANLNYNGYRPVYASGFQNMSTRDLKKDIEPFDENGVEIINNASIKTYRYKEEDEDTKKHIGLIFDEAPPEITQQAGAIDLYAMCSVAWKAIQELSQKIESLEEKIEGVKE